MGENASRLNRKGTLNLQLTVITDFPLVADEPFYSFVRRLNEKMVMGESNDSLQYLFHLFFSISDDLDFLNSFPKKRTAD